MYRFSQLEIIMQIAGIVGSAMLAIVCILIARVFFDVSRGSSPFSEKHAKRILLAGIAMVVFSICMTLIYNEEAIGVYIGDPDTMARTNGYITRRIVPGSYFVSTLFVFVLYGLFKYGILLQQVSDDTI